MNKATTKSYFPFFGLPYHLISTKKFQGAEIMAWNRFFLREGGEREGGGGVIFGPRIFFWFRRETDKSVLIKLHGKKKKKLRLSAH